MVESKMGTTISGLGEKLREYAEFLSETIEQAEIIYGDNSDVVNELGMALAEFKEIFSDH